LAVPGHERLEVPLIEKKKAQVLSVSDKTANIMDLESFDSFDVPILEGVEELQPEDQVEYWVVDETQKFIKRKL